MNIKKLSIIIPAYNEGRTIQFILNKVKDVALINEITKEIIIVTDCSTDDSERAIENYITINLLQTIQHKNNSIYSFKRKTFWI